MLASVLNAPSRVRHPPHEKEIWRTHLPPSRLRPAVGHHRVHGAIVLAMDMPLDASADAFTEAGFRARARSGLLAVPSPAIFDPRSGRALGPSDWDLTPEFRDDLAVMAPPRPAAVLVPIVLRSPLAVMLTQRSHDMPSHPGQISFPGGKVEPHDTSPVECALREAREEIGLEAQYVEVLGFLDSYRTGTGFQINPVVALVRPGFSLVPDQREVLEVFEVPLAFLMNEANHQKHARAWRGQQRVFYAMPYEGRYIWGATAGMLKNMHQRLFQR
jgi:8-oxo-dGTP pyrophosphatase MutT (NUDIX family)